MRTEFKAAQVEVAKSSVDGYIGLSSAYEKLGWREIALLLLRRVCEELPEEARLRQALERLLNASTQSEIPQDTTETITTAEPQEKPKKRQIVYGVDGTVQLTWTYEYNSKGQMIREEARYSEGI